MSAALIVNAKPDLREMALFVTILTSVPLALKTVQLTTIVSTLMARSSVNVHLDTRVITKTAMILMNVKLGSIHVKVSLCAIILKVAFHATQKTNVLWALICVHQMQIV